MENLSNPVASKLRRDGVVSVLTLKEVVYRSAYAFERPPRSTSLNAFLQSKIRDFYEFLALFVLWIVESQHHQ